MLDEKDEFTRGWQPQSMMYLNANSKNPAAWCEYQLLNDEGRWWFPLYLN